ncbi:rust resistance kinase Lr10-like [Durio zibethinus]|uniref:non-specific serine/threonine protein kinase n=1 Tax=Durio zibethinus TaxID=66656 RepID=A0A6P5Y1E7_DURZI|nr:rust resistance kinase Lr10-like [Durio zibethinus]
MRKQASAVFLEALFPLSILFFFIPIFHARNLQQCSSSCGDLKNISYPFRLQGDPVNCGDLSFQLSCQNNKAILNFRGGKYYVKGISYDEHTIRIVDVNLGNGSCSLPYRSLSMYEATVDSRYPSLINFWQANFVNCSDGIPDLADSEVPCLSGNDYHFYVNFSDRNLFAYDIPNTCKVISMVPTSSENKVNYPYETTMKLLASGFDLRWSVECRDCRAAGLSCVYKSNNDPRIFQCETLDEYDYETQLQIAIAFLVSNSVIDMALVVRFIFVPLVVFAFLLHKYFTGQKTVVDAENFRHSQILLTPKRYSYTDILAMTNDFKHKLGQGGFGSVYKGQLLTNGCLVAVKMLVSSKLSEENFINEVSTLSKIQHSNVIKLLGFCSEGSKHALVYEYMPNGSLDKHIFSKGGNAGPFSWDKLHEITLGIAEGIEFLHSKFALRIAHFDIKPRNILLDQNFVPKITDFGFAKFYPKKNDFISICATNETVEYMAPELISRDHGAVSCKSDVYSFGMLLLELASRRRNVNESTDSNKVYLPSWVYDQINEGKDMELENVIESETTIARKMFITGLWCTQTNALYRPSMARVVEMLQGKIDGLELPPKPVSFSQNVYISEPQSDSPKELLIPESMQRSA